MKCPLNPPKLGDFNSYSPQNCRARGRKFYSCRRFIVVFREAGLSKMPELVEVLGSKYH
jgi:hypothetical protein